MYETLAMVICVVLVVVGVFGCLAISSDNRAKEERINSLASIDGFHPERTLLKTSIVGGQRGISIDSDSRKIILMVDEHMVPLPFADVLETQVIVDGATVARTSRPSQALGVAVGGLMLGGVGAVIGGLSGKTVTKQEIKNVILRILVNNSKYPIHDIGFIESTYMGLTAGSDALREAETWHALLKVVIFQGQRELAQAEG